MKKPEEVEEEKILIGDRLKEECIQFTELPEGKTLFEWEE